MVKTKPGTTYLHVVRKRYEKAGKKEKSVILDELTKTTGYTRKHAIAILTGNYHYKVGKVSHPRAKTYTEVDAVILAKVCDLLDWINSKRVKPVIGIAIDSLVTAGTLVCSKEQRSKLVKISPATIDRLLKTYKKRPFGKGRSYTKPGTLLKSQIPIRVFSEWSENKVGFEEIDLVGHDGGNLKGDVAFTLNVVDVKSCWTEQVAVRNKAQVHVFAGIQRVRGRLPFPLLGIDSDSGSEFINDHLYRYCITEKITFTRGRPGKKNDNPFVEQKNDSVVRRWVGYKRYDTQEHVHLLNELYEVLRLYANFFLPVQKLKEKVRVASKVTKIHDKATTPYKRILRAKDIAQPVKEKLRKQYQTLNLVVLKERLNKLTKELLLV